MRIIFSVYALLLSTLAFSQVTIGGTSPIKNPSVSIQFGNSGSLADRADTAKQKGLLLPWVDSSASVTGAVPGTMIFDTTDKKVKVLQQASIWKDLSVDNTGAVVTSAQTTPVEIGSAKTTVGIPGNTAGILVLEDKTKAMILPLVDKYTSIISPSPGMMAYDLTNQMFCLYNGAVWTFWQP